MKKSTKRSIIIFSAIFVIALVPGRYFLGKLAEEYSGYLFEQKYGIRPSTEVKTNTYPNGDAEMPLERKLKSFNYIVFVGDNTIKRNFVGHVIIKKGVKPKINFETDAFITQVNKVDTFNALVIRLNKAVIEKENYNVYALTITADCNIRIIDNEFNDFDINLNNLEGGKINLIKSTPDGSFFHLNHCSFKQVNLCFQNNNYLWADNGCDIGSVNIQDDKGSSKLFHTKDYPCFITEVDEAGRIMLLTDNGYYEQKSRLNEEKFRKSKGESLY